nr:hypothetical protein [Ensifer sp. ENS10]
MAPGISDARGNLIGWFVRIHFEVVVAVGMRLKVKPGFTDRAIAALATLKVFDRRMNADPEDVQMCCQFSDLVGPAFLLDDMLDDQIVAGPGESRNRAVKSVEEPVAFAAHPMVHATLEHPKAGVGKLI